MKSVVAEASSISKAIELAWQKAGQPKEFLVKVFQEPQRNMFGLTKTNAKIGIFFDDAALTQKIKTASQNTIPTSINTKPVTPITPIKPIGNRPPAPKPATPRPAKPQPKVEVTQPTVQASQPVIKNQTVNQAPVNKPVNKNNPNHKPNPNRRNSPVNRPANQPNPNKTNIAQNTTPSKPELELPIEQSLVDQVISLIAKESNTRANQQEPSSNQPNQAANTPLVAADGSIAPRPARSKYYRRRKPRSIRPSTGEGSQAAPVTKNDD